MNVELTPKEFEEWKKQHPDPEVQKRGPGRPKGSTNKNGASKVEKPRKPHWGRSGSPKNVADARSRLAKLDASVNAGKPDKSSYRKNLNNYIGEHGHKKNNIVDLDNRPESLEEFAAKLIKAVRQITNEALNRKVSITSKERSRGVAAAHAPKRELYA